jgi:hypothetical protein
MRNFPMGTGAAAALVGVPEHRARNLIRRGNLSVPCVGNRRMWFAEHVLALAKLTAATRQSSKRVPRSSQRAEPEKRGMMARSPSTTS